MNARTVEDLLPAAMLERFRARAAEYDAANRFFAEDFAELTAAGYLAAPVPLAQGGAGLDLAEVVRAQRLLAAHAPATALGINMHLVWVQVARFLHERGIGSLDWVFTDAVAGEVFAFGISEAGNDAVLLDAFAEATPQHDGGYLVSGMKVFTTLSPVWTRLGLHAKLAATDDAAAAGEDGEAGDQLVFGFARRAAAGVRSRQSGSVGLADGTITHPHEWNPLGMRATQSWNTQLDGVRIAPRDVAATIAPFDGSDPLVLAIFSSFSILTAAVYAGIADRALELATAAAQRPMPGGEAEETLLDDPDTVTRLTTATLEHRASLDALAVLAGDIDALRSRTDWFLALAAARNRVTDEARQTVDLAMRLGGSKAFQADSELARLYRDVVAGLYHPSSARALAKTVRGSFAQQA